MVQVKVEWIPFVCQRRNKMISSSSSAERSHWKGVRFLSLFLSVVIVGMLVAGTALICCLTIYERSTGESVFCQWVDNWLFSVVLAMGRRVNIQQQGSGRSAACGCVSLCCPIYIAHKARCNIPWDSVPSVTLSGSEPVQLGSCNDFASISLAVGCGNGTRNIRKLGAINNSGFCRRWPHLCGTDAARGSVRRYLLHTEVARWFAKAPSIVSRMWRGHQDREQYTRRVGRGGTAGQQPNKRTTF